MRWLIGIVALGLWSCGGSSPKAEQPAEAAAPADAPVAEAPPVEPAEPEAAPPSVDAPAPEEPEVAEASDDALTVGVAECDEYITKILACLESPDFPEAARVETRKAFAHVVEQWKGMPEEAKADLGRACATALDAARKAYAQMGCTF